jgi:sensor c-di-GMP phosphodiesterase-like protein
MKFAPMRLRGFIGGASNLSPKQLSALLVGAAISFALPVLAALHLATLQAREADARDALLLAQTAIDQIERVSEQAFAAADAINALSPGEACEAAGLDTMRRIDLGSTLVQGVGWVEGNSLRCSSFAGNKPYPLGPPDYVSSSGYLIRSDVRLLGRQSYIVVQAKSAATIVHPDLALTFENTVPGAAIVVFSWSRGLPVLHRGNVPAHLLRKPSVPGVRKLPDGRTLAIVKSQRTDIGTLVLLPAARTSIWESKAASLLLPLGIGAGFIIATLFVLAARDRASIQGMIRSALTRKQFYLCYQPIIALDTNRIVAVEALLRWRRGTGREIAPDIFIQVAEQRGLMPALTDRVIEILLHDLPVLSAAAPELEVAVNFAAGDLHRSDLCAKLDDLVARTGLPQNQLIVEATERSMLDPEVVGATFRALRKRGVRIAIDDFGTGYSSLAYLAVLEVDILKIDKLFIQALGTGSATSQVAESVIEMARALSLTTIAEGIETPAQEAAVRALGIDRAQGFLFARPLSLARVTALLDAQTGAPR